MPEKPTLEAVIQTLDIPVEIKRYGLDGDGPRYDVEISAHRKMRVIGWKGVEMTDGG